MRALIPLFLHCGVSCYVFVVMSCNSIEGDGGENTAASKDLNSEEKAAESPGFSFGPGQVLFLLSVPLCAGTYMGYHSSVAVEKVIGKSWTQSVQDLSTMDEGLRRVLATAMAIRAFRIATMGTMGCFALLGAGIFYVSGLSLIHI